MNSIPQNVQRPEGTPPQGTKSRSEEAFTPNEPEQDGGSEVGGRDLRRVNGRLTYPSFWHTGVYIWATDGDVYSGPHWHPNPRSPLAYDLDNE
jgi:hypothetical protein